MSRNQILLFCLLIFLIAGCASGGSKFIGKWRPVTSDGSADNSFLIIQKRGKVYHSYNTAVPDISANFNYDREHDYLRLKNGGKSITIIYLDSTGRLRVVPGNELTDRKLVLEFEKTQDL